MRSLVFIVDDEPAIGRMIALALHELDEVDVEQYVDFHSMAAALNDHTPDVIFLDVSLGSSDGIDAIRHLSAVAYPGVVQLMSGRDAALLSHVRLIGERHGLRMRHALCKPFRIADVKAVVEEERHLFSGARSAPAKKDAAAGRDNRGAGLKVSLSDALKHDRLEIWYQPKIDLLGRRVIGAEGLARVRDPDHGIALPGAFLPDATGGDLIALAECALLTALRDAAAMAAAGHSLKLAVNMPVEALISLPIAAIVRDARPKGDDWSGIVVEVTEDQIIRDIPLAHEIAVQLRIHRIGLSLDDFGSGYSSLARIKELPFEELKLDRSFVTGCSLDDGDAMLCRTAIELAHRFGSLAVAEGIETSADLKTIRRLGCDLAQGFLFAEAMPRDRLLSYVEGVRSSEGFAA